MESQKDTYIQELDKSAKIILETEQESTKQLDMAEQNRKVMATEIDYLKTRVQELEQEIVDI